MAGPDIAEGLLRASLAVLRPLVRRLMAQGVTFGQLEARLRELFVDVAEQDFALPDRPQTDSRVALLTGLTARRSAGSARPASAAPRRRRSRGTSPRA